MFVDQIKVYARAGKGGDGSMHFHRGKFRPKGGPDGGDGGKGGSIILQADPSTNSLRTYFFNAKLLAQDGDKEAPINAQAEVLRISFTGCLSAQLSQRSSKSRIPRLES